MLMVTMTLVMVVVVTKVDIILMMAIISILVINLSGNFTECGNCDDYVTYNFHGGIGL